MPATHGQVMVASVLKISCVESQRRLIMILGLYTVYDIIAQEAGPVYEAVNNGVALKITIQCWKSSMRA